MAPIKFEENIREKLEERELQPSKLAWEKLSTQLDAESETKSRSFMWLAIAASFVGVLIIASVLFNQSTIPSEENIQLVIEDMESTESIQLKQEVKSNTEPSEVIQKSEVASNEKTSEENVIQQAKVSKKPIVTPNEGIAVNKKEEQNILKSAVAKNDNNIDNTTKSILTKEEAIFNNKVDEVVSKVKMMQSSNSAITAEEIDALLQSAQKDIANQRILSTKKVDATALLLDVEFELERSFRDKVFEALGDGFQKIRTAVVERNN